jgi:hypothetical protein
MDGATSTSARETSKACCILPGRLEGVGPFERRICKCEGGCYETGWKGGMKRILVTQERVRVQAVMNTVLNGEYHKILEMF